MASNTLNIAVRLDGRATRRLQVLGALLDRVSGWRRRLSPAARSELAELVAHLRDECPQAFKLTSRHVKRRTATGALEVRVDVQFTERFLERVRALRALERKAQRVKR